MKINEIKRGMSNITLQAKIVDISQPRQVQTKFGVRSVADATIEDETGQMTLSLWEANITTVRVGDMINISGAYTTEFRDKLQLNIPRMGKLEIVKA